MDGPSYMRQVAMLIANEAANKHRLASGQPAEMFVGGPRAAQEPGTPDAWDREFERLGNTGMPTPDGARFRPHGMQQAEYPTDPAGAMKSSAAIGKPTPAFDGSPKEDVRLPESGSPLLRRIADMTQPAAAAASPGFDNGRSVHEDALRANDDYWRAQGKRETGLDGVDGLERIQQSIANASNGFAGLATARERFAAANNIQQQRVGQLTQAIQDRQRQGQFDEAQQNALLMNRRDNESRERIAGMATSPEALRSRAHEAIIGGAIAQGRAPAEVNRALRQYDQLSQPTTPPPSSSQPGVAPQPGANPPGSSGSVASVDDARLDPILAGIKPHFGDGKTPITWSRKNVEGLLDSLSGISELNQPTQSALLDQIRSMVGDPSGLGDATVRAMAKAMVNVPNQPVDTGISLTNAGDNRLQRTWDTLTRFQASPAYSRAIFGSRTVPLDGGDTTNRTPWLTSQTTLDKERGEYAKRLVTGNHLLSLLKKMGYQ